MTNAAFGWLWITLGFATGAVLGLRFQREDWLGGYASYRRRLIRLGHVSFFGLGTLNVLFGLSIPHANVTDFELQVAATAMMLGGLTMPVCCGLTAWRPGLKPLFVIPVACLLVAGWTTFMGLLRA